MSARERLLALAVVGVLGVVGLRWGLNRYWFEPMSDRSAHIQRLQSQLLTRQGELYEAKVAKLHFDQWRRTALPRDLCLAQTLYQDYLRGLLEDASVTRPSITALAPRARGETYAVLVFSVRAECGLDRLSQLLRGFYQAPYLHAIRRLNIQPVGEDGRVASFDVLLAIEALAMPDTVATENLPTLDSDGPRERTVPSDWSTLLVEKKLFQPTRFAAPPPPPAKIAAVQATASPKPDDRGNIYVVGTVVVDGAANLWLVNRRTGEQLRFAEGSELRVDGMDANVLHVSPESVLLEVDGQVGTVRLRQSLLDWTASSLAEPKALDASVEADKSEKKEAAREESSSESTRVTDDKL